MDQQEYLAQLARQMQNAFAQPPMRVPVSLHVTTHEHLELIVTRAMVDPLRIILADACDREGVQWLYSTTPKGWFRTSVAISLFGPPKGVANVIRTLTVFGRAFPL